MKIVKAGLHCEPRHGQVAVRSLSGLCGSNIKNRPFNRNFMERRKTIHTGRSGHGQHNLGHSEGILCPMPRVTQLLSPFPMTAEVTAATLKPKTARLGG
jgi:hypothetical protein